jgi:hypothetical protein
MNKIKLLGVVFVVASLAVFGFSQFHFVSADQENNQGNGNSTSSSESESFSSVNGNGIGSIVRTMTPGNSGENNGEDITQAGMNSQNGTSFSVSSSGNVSINGASIVSNSGSSLSVKIFGLNLNLVVVASTALVGQASASSTLSVANMNVGDIVDARGQIDSNSGIISISQILDRNMNQQNIQNIQQQSQSLLNQLNQLRNQLTLQTGN